MTQILRFLRDFWWFAKRWRQVSVTWRSPRVLWRMAMRREAIKETIERNRASQFIPACYAATAIAVMTDNLIMRELSGIPEMVRRRTWRERMFSLPWRPLKKYRTGCAP